jgi:hypothetical protein
VPRGGGWKEKEGREGERTYHSTGAWFVVEIRAKSLEDGGRDDRLPRLGGRGGGRE